MPCLLVTDGSISGSAAQSECWAMLRVYRVTGRASDLCMAWPGGVNCVAQIRQKTPPTARKGRDKQNDVQLSRNHKRGRNQNRNRDRQPTSITLARHAHRNRCGRISRIAAPPAAADARRRLESAVAAGSYNTRSYSITSTIISIISITGLPTHIHPSWPHHRLSQL